MIYKASKQSTKDAYSHNVVSVCDGIAASARREVDVEPTRSEVPWCQENRCRVERADDRPGTWRRFTELSSLRDGVESPSARRELTRTSFWRPVTHARGGICLLELRQRGNRVLMIELPSKSMIEKAFSTRRQRIDDDRGRRKRSSAASVAGRLPEAGTAPRAE